MNDDAPATPAEPEYALTLETIAQAARAAGLDFTEAELAQMQPAVNKRLAAFEQLRAVPLANDVPPAWRFDPELLRPAGPVAPTPRSLPDEPGLARPAQVRPDDLEALAFWPVTALGQLLRTRQITATELTELYLERLKRYDESLQCVVTLTEPLAREQARQADEEIGRGHYRGPLHGIPWGAKDLLAVRGYPTTWGAEPFRDQVIDEDATVVERLNAAGAVLVAKLSTGALAYGDIWFGGTTRNPWNLEEGSSGSSAGPAAAVAAGLVGFSIGSETLGSIVSPSRRCGVTGLRPTFGRVSRHGAMALSWTMDKIGPIARSAADCGLVFSAIYGPDGRDPTVVDRPFDWPRPVDLAGRRIGYVADAFDEEYEGRAEDQETLAVLEELGAELVPLPLPEFPYQAMMVILMCEAAAAFDELTRDGRDELLAWQVDEAWPNTFRHTRLVPAVEYIQANRIRTRVMAAMAAVLAQVDAYLSPAYRAHNLILTNFTGHPAVILPNGWDEKGSPANRGVTLGGRLYGEAGLLAVAQAYQAATGFHQGRPDLG